MRLMGKGVRTWTGCKRSCMCVCVCVGCMLCVCVLRVVCVLYVQVQASKCKYPWFAMRQMSTWSQHNGLLFTTL